MSLSKQINDTITKTVKIGCPPTPIKCTLCDDGISADACTQCHNDLCITCMRKTLEWCPAPGQATFFLRCPWCRLTPCVGDETDFGMGGCFLLKKILSSADTHVVQVTAKCCGKPTIVLRHRPCHGGCFDCPDSTIEIVAVSFPSVDTDDENADTDDENADTEAE